MANKLAAIVAFALVLCVVAAPIAEAARWDAELPADLPAHGQIRQLLAYAPAPAPSYIYAPALAPGAASAPASDRSAVVRIM